MIKQSSHVFSPARRTTLKTTGAALCAGMLPLAATTGWAQPRAARYRRPNATGTKAGARMLDSYTRAVRAMLALPPEDPRNWYRQAVIHTLDCPHGNWWFLPWHRGYLGWFEQVCRELSKDPYFALPYWDWTTEPRLPARMFDDVLDPNHHAYIANASGFEQRLKAAIANAGYWTSPNGVFNRRSQYGQLLTRKTRFDADLLFDIVAHPAGRMFHEQPGARGMRRERPDFTAAVIDAVSPATIRSALAAPDFTTFASPKSSNHATSAGFGILEGRPHNSVHRCVGSLDCNLSGSRGFMADMLSPVDPVFFLHHANMDRLWDVWTRKQLVLGQPILPAGVELRSDLPDEQKPPEETSTDYYRWAREPMLFFVDSKGKPVNQTRAEDYAAMAAFDYDYEAGAGEEVVIQATSQPQARMARRVYAGRVTSRLGQGRRSASAVVQAPAGALEQAAATGATLVAVLTLNFPQMTHNPFVVTLNGPDDPGQVDTNSPFFLGTIVMFGHHEGHGELSYALPLGDKLARLRAARAMPPDGALRLRVAPMKTAESHQHGMDGADAIELLDVRIEAY